MVPTVQLTLLSLFSYLLSWKLWDPVMEQMVLKRKEIQGLPVRDGDVELMQTLMPEGMVVVTIGIIITMAVAYPRIRNIEESA